MDWKIVIVWTIIDRSDLRPILGRIKLSIVDVGGKPYSENHTYGSLYQVTNGKFLSC